MKKILKIIFLLGVLFLVYQLFLIFFINEHSVSYSIVAKDKRKYFIDENFKKVDDDYIYSFTIKDKKKVYTFSYNKDLNKQEEIISDIKYYKSNNLECIYPIYKKNNTSDMACLLNNRQVSYSYLKQVNNKDLDKIINKLKKDNYKSSSWESSDSSRKYNTIRVYEKNIPGDYIYTVWFYKGIYIVNNKNTIEKELLQKDKYENNLSMLTGKFYVTFNTDLSASDLEYSQFILYNIKDGGRSEIDLENKFSLNTYINGVYDNMLYITDNDNKKQYVLDPNKQSIKEVGDKDIGFKALKNNKLINIRTNKDNIFYDSVSNKNITKLYGDVEVKKYREDYYFKTGDGEVYKVINQEYKNPIKLFQFPDIKEWKVKDNAISFVVGDTIYIYTDVYGLRPIIIDKELNYNYKNIYDFMKK